MLIARFQREIDLIDTADSPPDPFTEFERRVRYPLHFYDWYLSYSQTMSLINGDQNSPPIPGYQQVMFSITRLFFLVRPSLQMRMLQAVIEAAQVLMAVYSNSVKP